MPTYKILQTFSDIHIQFDFYWATTRHFVFPFRVPLTLLNHQQPVYITPPTIGLFTPVCTRQHRVRSTSAFQCTCAAPRTVHFRVQMYLRSIAYGPPSRSNVLAQHRARSTSAFNCACAAPRTVHCRVQMYLRSTAHGPRPACPVHSPGYGPLPGLGQERLHCLPTSPI